MGYSSITGTDSLALKVNIPVSELICEAGTEIRVVMKEWTTNIAGSASDIETVNVKCWACDSHDGCTESGADLDDANGAIV